MVDSTNLQTLATLIAADLGKSTSTRQNLGGGGQAFAWAAELPPTIASYCLTSSADGMSVPVTIVTESGTPVTSVAAGSNKPLAATVTPSTLALKKFAGYAQVQLEQQLNAEGIYPAVVSVLAAGALKAFEADAMVALAAQNGQTATGANWIASIYAGQGKVLAAGGRPSVIAASAADYGTIMGLISTSAGYALDPASPTGVFAGSKLHFSSGLATGTVFVLDAGAVLCAQHTASPVLSVDSSGINNTTRVIADLIAGTIVTSPQHVVECTVA